MKHSELVNPCMRCEFNGCGKHATCKKYAVYFAAKQAEREKRLREIEVDAYTADEIRKVMTRPDPQLKKYRPKERKGGN